MAGRNRQRYCRNGRPDNSDNTVRRHAGTDQVQRRHRLSRLSAYQTDRRQTRCGTQHRCPCQSGKCLHGQQYNRDSHHRRNCQRYHFAFRSGPAQDCQHPGHVLVRNPGASTLRCTDADGFRPRRNIFAQYNQMAFLSVCLGHFRHNGHHAETTEKIQLKKSVALLQILEVQRILFYQYIIDYQPLF